MPSINTLKKWYPHPQKSRPNIDGIVEDPFNSVTTIIIITESEISVNESIGYNLASFSNKIYNSLVTACSTAPVRFFNSTGSNS